MLLGLATAAIVLTVLVLELVGPRLRAELGRVAVRVRDRLLVGHERGWSGELGYDPGRERRAELRAGALLRSCVNEEEWAMYRDLGFLRVWGRSGVRGSGADPTVEAGTESDAEAGINADAARERNGRGEAKTPRYAYLIYPHKPIVAYRPETGAMLSEYCVAFPDHSRPYGSARLPDSDDVLAKWMALTADEHRLIADANMHLPGRQVDPDRVKRDLGRLARWEHERSRNGGSARESPSGSAPVDGTNPKARSGPGAGQVRLGAGSVRAA
jgi:hypothetical protein